MKKLLLLVVAVLFMNLSYGQEDDSYRTSLKQMLEVSGSQEAFKTAIKQMMNMQKQNHPNIPAEFWTEFEKEFLGTSLDDLVDMLTPVYKKHLTEEDLKAVVQFYNSPVGKKFASKTPVIMQESMQVGQQWGMKVGMKLVAKMKEKGYGK